MIKAILEQDRKWLLLVAERMLALHTILQQQPWLQSTYDLFKTAYDAAESRRREMLQAIEQIKPDARFPAPVGQAIVELQHAGALYHRSRDVFRATVINKIGPSLAPIANAVNAGEIGEQQILAIAHIYSEIEDIDSADTTEKTSWWSYILTFLGGAATDHLIFKGTPAQEVGGAK